jgi:hypothetical protein
VVANPAFGRPWQPAVLHPVPGENPNRAVIHLDWKVHRKFPLTVTEPLPEMMLQSHDFRGNLELLYRDIEEIAGMLVMGPL